MPILTSAPAADWLCLWRVLQHSEAGARRLLKHFTTPGAALAAPRSQWLELGLSPVCAGRLEALQSGRDPRLLRELTEGVAADLAWCTASGQGLVTLDHPDYPPLLRELPDPPPLLFLRGDPLLLSLPQVAVVGTRHPSPTGRADAEAFAGELARAGLVVTSGLARGIDAAAHQGALRAGGRTLAVLGTGANRPYPRDNARLYLAIARQGGLVVSEFLPGEIPRPMNFPRRNRVISGLSLGVLVVEAAPESGSLITARKAAEQGRLVWALPGSRHNVQAQGCISLLREGASAVASTDHILADLPPMLALAREQLAPARPVAAAAPARVDLEPALRAVLGALGEEARHPDRVIAATGQAPAQVLQALSRLEVAGFIAAVPGGYARLPRG